MFAHILTSPLLLTECLLSLLAIYVLAVVVYRLTLHPLARYPGPFLAKITDLYLAYHAWKGDRHLEFYRCHEKYGSVVRLGPNLLSFNTVTALKQIYGFRANVRKADFYTAFPANKHTFNVHNVLDKRVHARKRRVIAHAFAEPAIKSMERYITGNVDVACGLIRDDIRRAEESGGEKGGWGLPRNVAHWADWLAFDIMGDLVFGKAFGMLEEPRNRFAVDLVSSAAHRHLICGTHLTIHNWHLDRILFRAIAAKRAQYMAYSRAQARARTALGADGDRRDFFHHLLSAKDPETGAGLAPDELWGESNLFIIAGSDTTSTALAATLFYLSHSPADLAAAQAEVRAGFPGGSETVTSVGPALAGCAYLRACIDEAMRLAPPVPGALPRRVLPGGLLVDGLRVPAGVDVCVPHHALHRNAAYFPAPAAYRPARWLAAGDDEADDDKDAKAVAAAEALALARDAFAPFSVGPRACVGKGLAYVELTVALARLLVEFDLRVAPGTHVGEAPADVEGGRPGEVEYRLKDTFTSVKDGPMLQFRKREAA